MEEWRRCFEAISTAHGQRRELGSREGSAKTGMDRFGAGSRLPAPTQPMPPSPQSLLCPSHPQGKRRRGFPELLFASHFEILAAVLTLSHGVTQHSLLPRTPLLSRPGAHLVSQLASLCAVENCSRCSEAQEWASELKESASHGSPLAARLCWRVGGRLLWRTGQAAQREPGRGSGRKGCLAGWTE